MLFSKKVPAFYLVRLVCVAYQSYPVGHAIQAGCVKQTTHITNQTKILPMGQRRLQGFFPLAPDRPKTLDFTNMEGSFGLKFDLNFLLFFSL